MATDMFIYQTASDVLARFLGVGIFAIENYNHMLNFQTEVTNMVMPALSPVPESACSIIHACTVSLGLGGSVMFMLSGFGPFKKFANPSLKALLVFMVVITWNWWLHRQGVFLWEVADENDRRNRLIHCLKNASIFGLLLVIYQSLRVSPKRTSD